MSGKKFLLVTFVFASLLVSQSFGQDEKKDKLLRHQIGLNMGEFIPLFKTQSTNLDLNYRVLFTEIWAARTAFSYSQVDDDDGYLKLDLKLGVDRIFKQTSKFSLYSGVEFVVGTENYEIDDRRTSQIGGALFIGLQYRPFKHFSISTEPGFYYFYHEFRDPLGFINKYDSWSTYSISNVGHLLMSIHF
ncbi:MAG: hypothetical protein HRT71_16925 [Flavobacteriales bacterium]|nr:hypothetical protein [Flavobacteriales bacterium]